VTPREYCVHALQAFAVERRVLVLHSGFHFAYSARRPERRADRIARHAYTGGLRD